MNVVYPKKLVQAPQKPSTLWLGPAPMKLDSIALDSDKRRHTMCSFTAANGSSRMARTGGRQAPALRWKENHDGACLKIGR